MLLTHADLLKTHLESLDDLEGVAVHVDRKLDIRDLATKVLSERTAGALLTISLGGWKPVNEDGGAEDYWATLRYEFSFSTLPHILEEREMDTFDELLRLVVLSIHGWAPAGGNAAYCPELRWRCGPGSYLPDDNFLVYLWPGFIGYDFNNPIPES